MATPTIYDIAGRARVSIATVSRVLNGSPRVSDATRQRVFAVAEELGYEPNASAQSLARQNTRVVAAVVPMMTSPFFMEVLRGVQDRLDESDYDLVVYTTRTLDKVDGALGRACQRGRSDGMLLLSTPVTEERAQRLRNAGCPVVLVDAAHDDFDSVTVDNRRGGAAAVRHLAGLGHTRIGAVLPVMESAPARERLLGYRDALAEAGLDADDDLVVTADWDHGQHGYTRNAGYLGMRTLLDRFTDDPSACPTAVFVAADVMALGALRAAREAGLDAVGTGTAAGCEGAIDIVGFDDIASSAYVGLTTLRQPMAEMGQHAADRLLQRLAEPDLSPAHTVYAPTLVARETTGGAQPVQPLEAAA